MASSDRRGHPEQGATLVEVLVSIAILGLAGVAIAGGLLLTVKTSDIHRKQSTGGAEVRTYAEAIEKYLDTDGNYVRCAGTGSYAPGVVGYSAPSGFTAAVDAAVPLDGNGAVASGTCPSKDTGVQRLVLAVRSSDDRAVERLTLVVRRSCGTGTSCP